MELAGEVKRGAVDETSIWYRGIDKKTQEPTFLT
jgi:phage head maturation protease